MVDWKQFWETKTKPKADAKIPNKASAQNGGRAMKKAIGMVVPGDFKVYHALVVVNKTTNEEVETIFIKPKMEEEADFHHLYSSLGPDRKNRNKVAVKLFKALEKLSVKPKPEQKEGLLGSDSE